MGAQQNWYPIKSRFSPIAWVSSVHPGEEFHFKCSASDKPIAPNIHDDRAYQLEDKISPYCCYQLSRNYDISRSNVAQTYPYVGNPRNSSAGDPYSVIAYCLVASSNLTAMDILLLTCHLLRAFFLLCC